MKLSKRDIKECKRLAQEENLSYEEVKKAVLSYFDSIVSCARSLPYDNSRRIYTSSSFVENTLWINIPYLGRLGTFYSQYLKWRAQEAKAQDQIKRTDMRKEYTRPLVESAAKRALSGEQVDSSFLKERVPAGKYTTVWLVDKNNKKKAAKQVIVNK